MNSHLTAKGQKEHVGQTMIEFRSASAKKHQYTIAMYVDDMRLEKKNRVRQRTHLLLRRRIPPADGIGGQPGYRQENLGLLERTQGHCSLREDQLKLTHSSYRRLRTKKGRFGGPFFFVATGFSLSWFRSLEPS